ncbi:hypothetical protein BgiBS90_016956, partial [Biomphalaria glabrata]
MCSRVTSCNEIDLSGDEILTSRYVTQGGFCFRISLFFFCLSTVNPRLCITQINLRLQFHTGQSKTSISHRSIQGFNFTQVNPRLQFHTGQSKASFSH